MALYTVHLEYAPLGERGPATDEDTLTFEAPSPILAAEYGERKAMLKNGGCLECWFAYEVIEEK